MTNISKPHRVQLKRTKGWKMPPNTVSVARPHKFGNPFTVSDCRQAGFKGNDEQIAQRCVGAFTVWLTSKHWRENWNGPESEKARGLILDNLDHLRGKNLACFCPLDKACHADVLLELAND